MVIQINLVYYVLIPRIIFFLLWFKNVSFISNHLAYTLDINNNQNIAGKGSGCSYKVSIQFTNCTFDENIGLDHVVTMNNIGDYSFYGDMAAIELSDCNF